MAGNIPWVSVSEALGVFPVTVGNPSYYSIATMRNEVKDLMRVCERLISLAMQRGELSQDECDVIAYYAQELHEKTQPLCAKHNKQCDSSLSST